MGRTSKQRSLLTAGLRWYGVFFKDKPYAITHCHSNEQAISNVWRRKVRIEEELSFEQARGLMRAEILADRSEWKGKIKPKKRKITWAGLRNGKLLKTTKAVSAARAADNVWFALFKRHEEPVSEQTKAIYHNEITAKPVFGQPKPPRYHPRKHSHTTHGSLFDHG